MGLATFEVTECVGGGGVDEVDDNVDANRISIQRISRIANPKALSYFG